MKTATKFAVAAGVAGMVGAASLAGIAQAQDRGSWHGDKRQHASKVRHHGHHGHRGHKYERLMERFDTDKDGKLTQTELDDARKSLLARFDADKDGKLSLQEFEPLWLEVMRRRMVRGFQRLDIDGDAAITQEEFLKPFSSTVEKMDRNEDGVLDKQDRRRHHRRGGRHKQQNQ